MQLTDDLTGTPVVGSNARVWIDGQKPPIKKSDGRSIFVDLPEGEYILNAEGGHYSHTQVPCKISAGKAESVTIRLLPNSIYPMPPGAVRIDGKAAPDSVIRVYFSDRTYAYKLLSDVKKGDNVIVSKYSGTEVKYEGTEYLIVKQDDILAIVE